jgi:hypothetical protein
MMSHIFVCKMCCFFLLIMLKIHASDFLFIGCYLFCISAALMHLKYNKHTL